MLFQAQHIAVHSFFSGCMQTQRIKTALGILPALCFDNYYFWPGGFLFFSHSFFFFTAHSKKDSGANSKAGHVKKMNILKGVKKCMRYLQK